MSVVHCTADAEFTSLLVGVGTTPVIVKFSAEWCPPCKMIAPFFNDLAIRNPKLKFADVDVDKCEESKTKFGITAMPTFVVVINGQKMDSLRGASKDELERLVTKWSANIPTQHESPIFGQSDLCYFFDKNGIECLNEDDDKNLRSLLEGAGTLVSDCDEQLIINIPFNVPVKIHSIQIEGPTDKKPKKVKVFANTTKTLDFDKAAGAEPIQTLDFSSDSLQGLKFVKFQNVQNIQLFVENNVGGGEQTIIESLRFFGSPLRNATDMGDFKRVAGKAGEAAH